MIIHVDASYEHNRFSICSMVREDGMARAFFMPMTFKLYGITFNNNQIISELYSIYTAVSSCEDNTLIYTDNEAISKMLNNEAKASNNSIHLFIKIVKSFVIKKKIIIKYISRKQNKMANNISLYILKSIKNLIKHNPVINNDAGRVLMIPINYSLNKHGELYHIYISKSIDIVIDGISYTIEQDFRTNCSNGYNFKKSFNWIKAINNSIKCRI